MNKTLVLFGLLLVFILPGCHTTRSQKNRRIQRIERLHKNTASTYRYEHNIIAKASQEELPCLLQEHILIDHDHFYRHAQWFTSSTYVNFPFMQYKTQLDSTIKLLERKFFWLQKNRSHVHCQLIIDLGTLINTLHTIRRHIVMFSMYRQEKKILDDRELRTIARHGGLFGLVYLFFTT